VLYTCACDRIPEPVITITKPSGNQDITNPGAQRPAEEINIIKLGFIGPISGNYASEGTAARNAFQMAVDEANESGRFPYFIDVIIIDDQSSEAAAIEGVRQIITDPAVVAVSGFWNSGPAAAAIPLFIEAEIPLLIWGAIREALTNENNVPWITRSAPTDKQENIPLAEAVIDDKGYTEWFVISDIGAYGIGNYDTFIRELSLRGITPVDTALVEENHSDFRDIVRQINSSGVKAVYCGSTEVIASRLKLQLYQAGITDIFFCGISGIKTEEFFDIGEQAAEGTLAVSPGIILTETEAGRNFIKAYNSRNYNEPIGSYTPYAYEAALILLNSLSVCSNEPAAEEMAHVIFRSRTVGLMGITTFNEVGQTTNVAAYLNVAQDGLWIPYQNSEYSSGQRSFGGR